VIRRRIPGTDLDLSVVGFGCWAIGGKWWGEVRDDDSIAAVRAAVDAGIDWFDTAPLYGYGHADAIVARALGDLLRDVVIATKCGVRWDGDGQHATSDLTPAHVRQDVEASLARFRVERLDLVQTHWPCERGTPLADTLGTLAELRAEGKIRAFGVCNTSAEQTVEARALGAVTLQTPYSLVRREFEGGIADAADGMAVLAYEPLCRGLLSGKFKLPPSFPDTDQRARDERFAGWRFAHTRGLVNDLAQIAAKIGTTPAALAVGWVADRPGVTAVIVGCKTPEQVRENARGAALIGKAKVWSVVDRIAAMHGGI
jgi:aryl-alcohol dehydrogenase-like predicted oxidoreductase